MARQAGPIYLIGTIDDITFYKMEGEYYARKKSSLDRRQFRTDPRFARSRKAAHTFGEASQLASAIYWQLPKAQRGKGVVNRLTGQVGQLLRKGLSSQQILKHFLQPCQPKATQPAAHPPVTDTTSVQTPTPAPALSLVWQVTPKGILIGHQLEQALSISTSHSSLSSAVCNSDSIPLLE